MSRRKVKDDVVGRCGDCVHVIPVTDFHTLTVHGRKPTLGTCPYMERRKVLLSERGCERLKIKD